MRGLADVQAAFVLALNQADLPVPEAVALKSGAPVKRRFDVYRNNVAACMIEALRATYPAVETLVGPEFFAASARVYLDRYPPRSPLLFRYGATFGDFLETFPPAASTPYVGDVARLEWSRLEAYHARDCRPLTIDALGDHLMDESGQEIDPGKLRFSFHPSLALIRSRWPVVSLWAASTGQGTSRDVDMSRPEAALVIRPELSVETHQLPEAGLVFMSSLLNGGALEEAVAASVDTGEDFDLTIHLQGLFAVGAVAAINNNNAA